MGDRGKKILLGFVLFVLMAPLIQQSLHVFRTEPLDGYYILGNDTPFNFESWIDGSYQEKENKYYNDNVSFRPDLIRLNCQIDYSLFDKVNTGWGVIGKNGCMLDRNYIDAWNGDDYVGYDTLLNHMVKLKAIQDTLAKLGKSIIFVHAASKGFFYADCIPDRFKYNKIKPTNFGTCLRIGDSLGINQLDLNTLFCKMRDTSREVLYPKQGIHWSFYGAIQAGEQMIRYIEKLRKIHMPHPYWKNIEHTTIPKYTDNDIARALNLIWPITTENFCYGTTTCDKDSSQTRPSAIYIGDSFTWTLMDNSIFDCIHSKWEFWYYFKQRVTYMGEPRLLENMDKYDWLGAINKTDCIVLFYNANNMNNPGSGFIEKLYDHYYPAVH